MIQSRAGCYWERLVRYLGPGNENSTLVASVYKTRGPAMISAKEKDTCSCIGFWPSATVERGWVLCLVRQLHLSNERIFIKLVLPGVDLRK